VLAELRARLHAMGIEPAGAQERTPLVVESRSWQPRAAAAGEGGAARDAAFPLASSSE
jgi:hypothetical protein